MKILKDYWWLFLIFISVTLIFVIGYKGVMPELEWKKGESLEILGVVFTKLLIVGALLDQFIAVFFPEDDTNKQQRLQAQNSLSSVREEEKFIHRDILNQQLQSGANANVMTSVKSLNSQLSTLGNTKRVAESKIAEVDSNRSSNVRKVAFAAGLVLSITGITILGDFIVMSDSINHKILSYIDIVFTAAVLSGGTSGINQLLRVIKDSWKKS